MPTVFKCEAEDDERDGEQGGCRISNDEAGFRIDMAIMATSVGSTDRIVQPVAYKPA